MIYSNKQNRLSFSDCELNYNYRADDHGGAVCLFLQSELNITGDSYFIGNHASKGGAVSSTEQSKMYISTEGLLMANNSATESGGAIHMSTLLSLMVTINSCRTKLIVVEQYMQTRAELRSIVKVY